MSGIFLIFEYQKFHFCLESFRRRRHCHGSLCRFHLLTLPLPLFKMIRESGCLSVNATVSESLPPNRPLIWLSPSVEILFSCRATNGNWALKTIIRAHTCHRHWFRIASRFLIQRYGCNRVLLPIFIFALKLLAEKFGGREREHQFEWWNALWLWLFAFEAFRRKKLWIFLTSVTKIYISEIWKWQRNTTRWIHHTTTACYVSCSGGTYNGHKTLWTHITKFLRFRNLMTFYLHRILLLRLSLFPRMHFKNSYADAHIITCIRLSVPAFYCYFISTYV